MDWKLTTQQLLKKCGKYKYAAVIVLLGLLFMNFPSTKESLPEPAAPVVEQKNVTVELTEILSRISGVGRVSVMVTESAGAETVYQTDLDETDGTDSFGRREKTVLYSAGGGDAGLVRMVRPASYLGAVVVCEGGDNPAVSLAVVQAVSKVLGISTDRIAVLKMK